MQNDVRTFLAGIKNVSDNHFYNQKNPFKNYKHLCDRKKELNRMGERIQTTPRFVEQHIFKKERWN